MEWISFESLALVVLVIALGAHLVWAEIKAAGQRIQDITDRRLISHWKDELAKSDEAERRRIVHKADLEYDRLRGKANLNELLAATNAVNTDEYRRRLNAGIANQHSASMEPFCGEGKKP